MLFEKYEFGNPDTPLKRLPEIPSHAKKRKNGKAPFITRRRVCTRFFGPPLDGGGFLHEFHNILDVREGKAGDRIRAAIVDRKTPGGSVT